MGAHLRAAEPDGSAHMGRGFPREPHQAGSKAAGHRRSMLPARTGWWARAGVGAGPPSRQSASLDHGVAAGCPRGGPAYLNCAVQEVLGNGMHTARPSRTPSSNSPLIDHHLEILKTAADPGRSGLVYSDDTEPLAATVSFPAV